MLPEIRSLLLPREELFMIYMSVTCSRKRLEVIILHCYVINLSGIRRIQIIWLNFMYTCSLMAISAVTLNLV